MHIYVIHTYINLIISITIFIDVKAELEMVSKLTSKLPTSGKRILENAESTKRLGALLKGRARCLKADT